MNVCGRVEIEIKDFCTRQQTPLVVLVSDKMNENIQIQDNVEIHMGPEVNIGENANVVSVENNEKTNLICNCSKVNLTNFI